MRFVIQRVNQAQVTVKGEIIGQIGRGMLIFIGIESGDKEEDVDHFVRKISELRVFEDAAGKMNLSASQVGASFLVVSQFTLLGNCEKGRRPSFDKAADPKTAEHIYNLFIQRLRDLKCKVETGSFRAMMDVALVNDGPVTFIL